MSNGNLEAINYDYSYVNKSTHECVSNQYALALWCYDVVTGDFWADAKDYPEIADF
jgi:hypothetical protein